MHASAKPFLTVLLAWLMLLLAPLAMAQGQPDRMDRGPAQLLVQGPVQPGERVELGLRFRPDPGWHGYWSNPGDAGQGMVLEWQLPPGWQAGDPRYPMPQRLLISGLMNHVFEGEHAVLVPLAVPSDAVAGRSYPVAVFARWLSCSDRLCVPQWATLQASVTVGADGTSDPRFDGWRAALVPQLDRPAQFALTPAALRIAIPLPAALTLTDPHVFVGETGLVDYAAPQSFTRQGDLLVAEIPRKGAPIEVGQVSGIIKLDDIGGGVRFVAQPGTVAAGGERIAGPAPPAPLWLLLGGALLGGLLLNLMPCVFPILSLKALSLVRAGESEAQARAEGLAYSAGVVLACLVLGAVMLGLRAAGEQVGWAFQLQQPGVLVALTVLAVVVTANLGGVFELPALALTGRGGRSSAFATGLLAAFVATPCTGPFMAAAMGAALLLPPVPALALFAALGLGLALPFLTLGFVPALRRLLPRPGAWMARFRRAMALPMGLTALALIWLLARVGGQGFALVALVLLAGIVIALVVVGRLQRGGKLAWPAFGLIAAPFLIFAAFALPASFAPPVAGAAESLLDPVPFSEPALAEARARGKPVFLWFTADWCVTCKVNESVAIEREATRAAFAAAGVVAMRGDWTRADPAITRFLETQGAAGVPLYLWYPAGGGAARQLPQVLGPDALVALAEGG